MASSGWKPGAFHAFVRRIEGSSTKPCEIETDCGRAFLKCIGNPCGPNVLACEWIGSRLAEIMGLETLDFSLLTLRNTDVPFDGGAEQAGSAFASRVEDGFPWAGDVDTLRRLSNPDDLVRLVVLDTYLLNWDRHSPNGSRLNKDNVFFSLQRAPKGKLCLIAMDFSHAISNGNDCGAFLGHIDRTKDERIYGLFPEYEEFIRLSAVKETLQTLGRIADSNIDELIGEVPDDWQVDSSSRKHLRTFLTSRRDYVVETLFARLSLVAGQQTAMSQEEMTE